MSFQRLTLVCTAPALALMAGAGLAQVASAPRSGAFTVSPLRIDLAQGNDHAEMTLSNALDRASAVQVRIFAWHQENGADRFTPSSDFVVSPSIFRMAPGSVQQFHIIRQTPATAAAESRYRIVIDQLPEPVAGTNQAANTRLQLTLPLFSGSELTTPAKLLAQLTGARLTIANAGGRTARIGSLAVVAADGSRWPIALDTGRYVLGQSRLSYDLREFDCARAGQVRVVGLVDRIVFDAKPQSSCP